MNEWLNKKEKEYYWRILKNTNYINFQWLEWIFIIWNKAKERGEGKYVLIYWGGKDIHREKSFQIVWFSWQNIK